MAVTGDVAADVAEGRGVVGEATPKPERRASLDWMKTPCGDRDAADDDAHLPPR